MITADFYLFDGVDYGRSSILFRETDDGCIFGALRTHVPPWASPDAESIGKREAVEALADLVEEVGPPVAGTEVYIYPPNGVPHVTLGDVANPRENTEGYPADAVLGFFADFKRMVGFGGD